MFLSFRSHKFFTPLFGILRSLEFLFCDVIFSAVFVLPFSNSVSHHITSGTQTGEFKSSEKAWYWNIKKLQGGSELSASIKVTV